MANLLTLKQQQTIKPITYNNIEKFDLINNETENNELRELLGVKLLQDIQNNQSSYSDLLNGSTFKDCSGDSITHRGINFVIAYFNYSSYVTESDIVDTFSGMVTKNRNESTSLPEGRIKRLQERSRQIALREFDLIKLYLDLNSDSYPLWCSANTKKPFKPKIFGIKRTNYGG